MHYTDFPARELSRWRTLHHSNTQTWTFADLVALMSWSYLDTTFLPCSHSFSPTSPSPPLLSLRHPRREVETERCSMRHPCSLCGHPRKGLGNQ
jgi:hypothetical protein